MSSILAPSHTVCLPFFFYDVLDNLVRLKSDLSVKEALSEAFEVVHKRNPSRAEIEQIAHRLQNEKDTAPAKEADRRLAKRDPKKSFGGRFSEWLEKLDATETCILVADFDPEKARNLYTKVDRTLVIKLAEVKIHCMQETANTQFEAVLFGMGGGYKGHMESDSDVINLSDSDKDHSTLLKSLGMMH